MKTRLVVFSYALAALAAFAGTVAAYWFAIGFVLCHIRVIIRLALLLSGCVVFGYTMEILTNPRK